MHYINFLSVYNTNGLLRLIVCKYYDIFWHEFLLVLCKQHFSDISVYQQERIYPLHLF
jgi:hypothetical protein